MVRKGRSEEIIFEMRPDNQEEASCGQIDRHDQNDQFDWLVRCVLTQAMLQSGAAKASLPLYYFSFLSNQLVLAKRRDGWIRGGWEVLVILTVLPC